MRKGIVFGLICLVVGLIIREMGGRTTPPPVAVPPKPSPTPTIIGHSLSYQGNSYRFVAYELQPDDVLQLIPNYENKIYASSLIEDKKCTKIFNGGFYDANSHPLGLVIHNREELSPYRANQLFNGFLSIQNQTYTISTSNPTGTGIHTAFQSGPMLIKNQTVTSLTLNRDKPSRRVVVVQDNQEKLVFLSVYDPNIPYGGPMLKDLPQLISSICHKLGKTCVNALNLDGGSASVFYISPEVYFRELEPVGSFLCVI